MPRADKFIDVILDIGRQCLLQRQGISMGADISQAEFAVIDLLRSGEKISCNELARQVGLSVSRSSRMIDRLLRKGYVVRRINPANRRCVQIWLSAKGVRLKKNLEKLKRQCERRIFGGMASGEIEAVRRGVLILRGSLRTHVSGKPAQGPGGRRGQRRKERA